SILSAMADTSQQPVPSPVWDNGLLVNPHALADKRQRVRKMFAAIAPSYDLNNRLHSLWQDQRWRRKAVKLAGVRANDVVVDIACGTGDRTLAFASAKPQAAIGVAFTFEMLPLAHCQSQIAARLRRP